jgi:hypothetical protein
MHQRRTRKMKYRECTSATEYLKCVLTAWKEFQKHNAGFCRAIEEILKENEELKQRVAELEELRK